MTVPNDATQTWRDVAHQLTPVQIDQLERLDCDEPQALLETARQWAGENMAAAVPCREVTSPAGAVRTFPWQLDGRWFRDFEGATRHIGPGLVQIYGRQQANAPTQRWIEVHSCQLGALDAGAARELAAALIAAADEIERLA